MTYFAVLQLLFLHVKIGGWESRITTSSGNVRPSAFQNADWCQDSSTPTTFLISIFFAVETKQEGYFLSKLSHNWVPNSQQQSFLIFFFNPEVIHELITIIIPSHAYVPKKSPFKKIYQKKCQIPGMFRLSRHFTEHLLRFLALPVTVQSQLSLSHVFTVRSSNLRKDFGCSACCSKPVAAAGA